MGAADSQPDETARCAYALVRHGDAGAAAAAWRTHRVLAVRDARWTAYPGLRAAVTAAGADAMTVLRGVADCVAGRAAPVATYDDGDAALYAVGRAPLPCLVVADDAAPPPPVLTARGGGAWAAAAQQARDLVRTATEAPAAEMRVPPDWRSAFFHLAFLDDRSERAVGLDVGAYVDAEGRRTASVMRVPVPARACTSTLRTARRMQELTEMKHANVLDIVDLVRGPDGRPYVVAPWCAGGSLETAHRHFDRTTIRDLLRDAARGLRGINVDDRRLHGAVRPDTVWIRFDGAGRPIGVLGGVAETLCGAGPAAAYGRPFRDADVRRDQMALLRCAAWVLTAGSSGGGAHALRRALTEEHGLSRSAQRLADPRPDDWDYEAVHQELVRELDDGGATRSGQLRAPDSINRPAAPIWTRRTPVLAVEDDDAGDGDGVPGGATDDVFRSVALPGGGMPLRQRRRGNESPESSPDDRPPVPVSEALERVRRFRANRVRPTATSDPPRGAPAWDAPEGPTTFAGTGVVRLLEMRRGSRRRSVVFPTADSDDSGPDPTETATDGYAAVHLGRGGRSPAIAEVPDDGDPSPFVGDGPSTNLLRLVGMRRGSRRRSVFPATDDDDGDAADGIPPPDAADDGWGALRRARTGRSPSPAAAGGGLDEDDDDGVPPPRAAADDGWVASRPTRWSRYFQKAWRNRVVPTAAPSVVAWQAQDDGRTAAVPAEPDAISIEPPIIASASTPRADLVPTPRPASAASTPRADVMRAARRPSTDTDGSDASEFLAYRPNATPAPKPAPMVPRSLVLPPLPQRSERAAAPQRPVRSASDVDLGPLYSGRRAPDGADPKYERLREWSLGHPMTASGDDGRPKDWFSVVPQPPIVRVRPEEADSEPPLSARSVELVDADDADADAFRDDAAPPTGAFLGVGPPTAAAVPAPDAAAVPLVPAAAAPAVAAVLHELQRTDGEGSARGAHAALIRALGCLETALPLRLRPAEERALWEAATTAQRVQGVDPGPLLRLMLGDAAAGDLAARVARYDASRQRTVDGLREIRRSPKWSELGSALQQKINGLIDDSLDPPLVLDATETLALTAALRSLIRAPPVDADADPTKRRRILTEERGREILAMVMP